MLATLKRRLVGLPLDSAQAVHERLSNVQALAVLSSDALSSVAYATEEILLVLILAGSALLSLSLPIALAITLLLIIVATSYYQTIHAYPNGGGAYIVAHENLGDLAGLVAGGALLTDYVLTVAVSISAGVAAITSAFPALFSWRVELALVAIAIITLVNLRGLRESGRVFSLPTYFFIVMVFALIASGMIRLLMGLPPVIAPSKTVPVAVQGLTAFLILRAFASGCTAMTGIEAISNGVPIFKRPEADNASHTLLWMAGILVSMFLGITFLASQFGIVPSEGQTVVSQLGQAIFGAGPVYYVLQATTALILLLAANTSYSDFPRLAMLMAHDRYLPRQLANLGDRLVFANGILLLGILAAGLVIAFGANTHSLIPLYAVGVFISFTLSQAGMVRHWLTLRPAGWERSAIMNGVGAFATGIVLIVVTVTKFTSGAWFVLLLLAGLVLSFRAIHQHYQEVTQQLSLNKEWPQAIKRHTIIVPVAAAHRGVLKAIQYAKIMKGDLHIVTVEIEPEHTNALRQQWANILPDNPLIVLPSPYRSVITPLIEYVDNFVQEDGDYVTIVIPEFVPKRLWHHLLHNETAFMLKTSLLYSRENWKGRFNVVTDVPFYLNR